MTRRVMLATALDSLDTPKYPLRFPMLASVKIDGVRAFCRGGRLYSRSNELIPNLYTQKVLGLEACDGLDGELTVGNPWDHNLMQQTMSGVMSRDGEPLVRWWIFDKWDEEYSYAKRAEIAKLQVANIDQHRILWLPHKRIDSVFELKAFEEASINLGFEGIMLRDPRGPYKQGRATLKEGWLLKLKRFADGEAEILSCVEQEHNANEATLDERGYTKRSTHQDNMVGAGILGAFNVRDIKTGVEFSVGTGFTLEQRKNLWEGRNLLKGKLIKYKHFVVGSKLLPRFPVFVGFRDRRDL